MGKTEKPKRTQGQIWYARMLKSPEWRNFRKQILERDNCACTNCGLSETEAILVVHHLYYIPGAKPWEYNTDALQTLCKACHYMIHL